MLIIMQKFQIKSLVFKLQVTYTDTARIYSLVSLSDSEQYLI